MPSTYTLNNGIELIGRGEQSAIWGDTTNANLELLDAALDGQVSVTLSTAGSTRSPNTLPVLNGESSNGRNRLVIFNDGGDLGDTAYVQLIPNDAEKIIYVRNSLSGSRSILLFQGTYNASNDYEIPAGTTSVIFFNGAGNGAVAANVFNNAYFDSLLLGSVSVTEILDEDDMSSNSATALATQQSIKAYVDGSSPAPSPPGAIPDLEFSGTSGFGSVDLSEDTFSIRGTANEIETSANEQTLTIGLPNNLSVSNLSVSGNLALSDLSVSGDFSVSDTNGAVGGGVVLRHGSSAGYASFGTTSSDSVVIAADPTRESNNSLITMSVDNVERFRIDSTRTFIVGDFWSKSGPDSSDEGLRIQQNVRDNRYGFSDMALQGNIVLTNEQGGVNQALVLGDAGTTSDEVVFGVSNCGNAQSPSTGRESQWQELFKVNGSRGNQRTE